MKSANFFFKPSLNGDTRKLDYTKVLGSVGIIVIVVLLSASAIILLDSSKKPSKEIPNTNPDASLKKTSEESKAASLSASERQKPINLLQQAYNDVVGSSNLKKSLSLTNGVATIEYTIASNDGQTILKSSYENFADLSVKTFNITGVTKLAVTSYATKLSDINGQANVYAVKLELSSQKNNQINWSLKKYAYRDYATILDLHQVNPALSEDYKNLLKQKSN